VFSSRFGIVLFFLTVGLVMISHHSSFINSFNVIHSTVLAVLYKNVTLLSHLQYASLLGM
jgi:hypothetical protein